MIGVVVGDTARVLELRDGRYTPVTFDSKWEIRIMKSLPEEMDDAIEALNLIISAAERKFFDLRLCVSASIAMSETHRLCFVKDGRDWNLALEHIASGSGTPLHSCSLEQRAQAVRSLPVLYERMLAASETRIAEINKVVADARAFLDHIP